MTLIERQRLIGAGLLLLMISVISYFLLSGANSGVVETESVQIEQTFTSVVQPFSEDDIEVVDYADETLLDLQSPSAIATVADIAVDIEAKVEQGGNIDTLPTVTTADLATTQWILQLGSFSVKSNAEALAEQLKTLGYKPSIESSDTNKGMIYRVRLAPIENKTTAENIAKEVGEKLNLKPQVFQQSS